MCKSIFLEDILGEVSLKIFFIIETSLLKRNLTIIYTSVTKSNFTSSYLNKNYFLKLIFDIFKSNKNYFFKTNSSKNNFFKKLSFKK